ncbi:MAG: hypothetical protein ACE366_07330 [Bradymonadia bacterium]
MTTLSELFPGNMGRMKMARVILMLRKPAIGKMDPNTPLPADLEREVRGAIQQLDRR